ncbi:MAG: hypothetical protein RLY57_478 [Candidatus Parcubacteria bacterium]|jgi:methylenetetrahydrofolate dehydrogenase (NADP+)/methenyltetrahydrofolate cyclohydrolase
MAQLLDGKKVAEGIKQRLKDLSTTFAIAPCLAIVQIGEDTRSDIYIRNKKLFGEAVGAEVRHVRIASSTTQAEAEQLLQQLSNDQSVHGIIMQLPIPEHLDKEHLLSMIVAHKDVDGISGNDSPYVPATARGVMSLLQAYNIELQGKRAVVIGRSKLVGAPTAQCLERAGAQVTVCHKETPDIPAITQQADIIVAAAGSPHLITPAYVREGQVIVDVGINPVTKEGDTVSYTVGDVDFKAVSLIVAAISPVPGGVGPLTVASLFENLFDAFQFCIKTQ